MYVFPVFTLEQVCEYEEERQVQQYIGTDALMLQLNRVSRVSEEGYQILDLLIELLFVQSTGLRHDGQLIILLLVVLDDLNLFAADHLTTLQTDQHVRHTDIRENLVVHTPRTRRVFIERTQVTVEPVSATNASNEGQVRRCSTEPGLGVCRLHADGHVVADLGTREHQVFQHQIMRNTQIVGNALIALELGTVAAHAIVGERTRAVLHGRFIGNVDVDFFQLGTTVLGCKGQHRHGSKNQYSK